ncbi:MAG TPA: PhzF family phenazine biosynthesis protein [Acidobacteriota bacterium]|nr:PhzF family phenazine biosynthesis protein [Acidobacteriota bacterium]
MRTIPLYQVDAFTDRAFAGNPAAVCPLEEWLDDDILQAVSAENNLSETAFFVPEEDGYHLRWFTPEMEVELCGHATLASAWVLWNRLEDESSVIRFSTLSGTLTVEREGELLAMSLPAALPRTSFKTPAQLKEGLGGEPQEILVAPYGTERNFLVLFARPSEVAALSPDFPLLAEMEKTGIIATAPGGRGDYADCDFVSRYFAPGFGIDEDPATGSAHATLAPFWADRLGRRELRARQISRRQGKLWCRVEGNRVVVLGQAACVIEGKVFLP